MQRQGQMGRERGGESRSPRRKEEKGRERRQSKEKRRLNSEGEIAATEVEPERER